MSHFISEPWLDNVFKAVISVTNTDYYAYVAQGWAVSVCAAKFPHETLEFLKSAPLSDAAFQKSLQKIAESKRIPDIILLFGNQPRIFSATFGNSLNELIVYSGFSVVPNPYDANTNGISASFAAI